MLVWVVVAVLVVLWKPEQVVAWAPLLAVVTVVVSTLVHEGAHAWAAHSLGYRVEWVVFGGMVGLTAYFGRDDRPLERAAVALAGPAASAVLVLALVGARASMTPATTAMAVVELALLLNVIGLVGNLLPVGGTDGANLLRGLGEHRRRISSADRPIGSLEAEARSDAEAG